jgi:hypothetical protein
MPLLLPYLADVGRARTELQKAFELGVLIAVGGVDVDTAGISPSPADPCD